MKKIAVGDLGEFWYGDYKEPFVQLEGGVPGHPQGVVLKDDAGKLMCAFCGSTYQSLATHVQMKHGMRAGEYKREVGLLQKTALVSETRRLMHTRTAIRNRAQGKMVQRGPNNGAFFGAAGKEHPSYTVEHLNKTGRCRAQVLSVARQLVRERRFGHRGLSQHGIGAKTIRMYFGSLDGLRRVVGLSPKNKRTIPSQELIDALRNLAFELGRTPTRSDLRRFGLPWGDTYKKRWGSYAEACRRAGLHPNLPPPEDTDLDLTVLTAYATHGDVRRICDVLHMGLPRIQRVFVRYGFPYAHGGRYNSSERRAWAADMVRRLADMSDSEAA